MPFRVAAPSDAQLRGNWWEMFNDTELNSLEAQVNISNQNIAQATAAYFSARALVSWKAFEFGGGSRFFCLCPDFLPTSTTGSGLTTSHRKSP